MSNTKDSGSVTDTATFEITDVGVDAATEHIMPPGFVYIPTPEPVEVTVDVGDEVKVRGTVVSVDNDAVTIEVDDGIENNIHRVTLNSRQAAVALKK